MAKLKCLGILLCYNDADILEDAIVNLLKSNHDLIVWDHGSDDGTSELLDKYNKHFIERRFINRAFDFYNLYQEMSKHLIENYINQYDWISWPDQDEILEGPDRSKSYHDWLQMAHDNGTDYIQFNNFNFWFTEADDKNVISPADRVRHYSLFADCAPRIRSWRASRTNIRIFNHNPLDGVQAPVNFNLRHYPMRTHEQMMKRVFKDRADVRREESNYHYENMAHQIDKMIIKPDQLFYDDGVSELNHEVIFNWRTIYGYGPVTATKSSAGD